MALMTNLKLKNWTPDPTRDGFKRKSDGAFVGYMDLGTTAKPTDKYLNEVYEKKMAWYNPTKVKKINCTRCGEILLKLYPWSPFELNLKMKKPLCKRCLKKDAQNKKN